MQLAAFWVKDHYLFETTSINLGGKFLYEFKLDGNILTINREENEAFIPHFFSETSPNLSLVSAIVGQNGSGKSTLLTLLRSSLQGVGIWGGYVMFKAAVLIFEDDKSNSVFVKVRIPEYPKRDAFNLKIQTVDFLTNQEYLTAQTVYYCPFFENKQLYFNSWATPDIDISADRLLHHDDDQNKNKSNFSPILEHRYQNIFRQFDFLGTPLAEVLARGFEMPFYDSVELSMRGAAWNPIDISTFHNTPFDFRPFLKRLYELWQKKFIPLEDKSTRQPILTKIKRSLSFGF
ncbi:hypothetical protein [Haliscomenobacter sp.]|uniref:hypothetical protein n=1 Tax=Haliscomenobacter sp. TaxID=2717303 RepID=UPI00359385C4